LKQRLQLLTLGIGGVGVVSAYVSYSPEIAASFGAGLIGSLAYLRMLGTSVDSLAGGTGETVKYVECSLQLVIYLFHKSGLQIGARIKFTQT